MELTTCSAEYQNKTRHEKNVSQVYLGCGGCTDTDHCRGGVIVVITVLISFISVVRVLRGVCGSGGVKRKRELREVEKE